MTANDSPSPADSGAVSTGGSKSGSATDSPYLVLARKYRPRDFDGLIGQEAMVQTLANAFRANRVHHAFMLTGVRGVGKTTTARILARAFNYEDETGRHPTLDLSRPGRHCQAIIEGRHVDVIEMDAASNTGIDDIREIIDSVKYAPASAPFKVYIIDEVHMLSRQAFNGLLKTLEEPPPYVKFIFATTEIRKVPVTVLSRCQRFDLRRIPHATMLAYLQDLLHREGIEAEADALSLIVRAGEGSVRDCLSLADQAISHGDGAVRIASVQAMLGLADSARILDLFEALMGGAIVQALDLARSLYDAGTDPEALVADLSRLTHLLTRFRLVPETADDPSLTPHERQRGAELAARLSIRSLTRTWQMLLAGLKEVAAAPNAMQSLEMLLVRISHAADLPTPDELVSRLKNESDGSSASGPASGNLAPPSASPVTGPSARMAVPIERETGAMPGMKKASASGFPARKEPEQISGFAPENLPPADFPPAEPIPDTTVAQEAAPEPVRELRDFESLVALAADMRELKVKYTLENHVRPIRFENGRMEIALDPGADQSVIGALPTLLGKWTGRNWLVSVSSTGDDAESVSVSTLRERKDAAQKALFDTAMQDPMVVAVMEQFSDAELVRVEQLNPAAEAATSNEHEPPARRQEDR